MNLIKQEIGLILNESNNVAGIGIAEVLLNRIFAVFVRGFTCVFLKNPYKIIYT